MEYVHRLRKFSFSPVELWDLFRSWAVLSLAFAIMFSGGRLFSLSFFGYMIMSAVGVGLGFILHELAHKFVAQRYGCWAEFRANTLMLWVALLFSFFGFIFAAPGAVVIQGFLTPKRYGRIALAGPLTNVVLAIMFGALSFVVSAGFLRSLFAFSVHINLWLALFNMLPFFVLDGVKVWRWDKRVFFATIIGIVALQVVWSVVA